ncbi:MAG: sulfite oxidase [Pseudomonadota bacterium]|nr:sulfite oxidase [Pseudomonadota bacterium]
MFKRIERHIDELYAEDPERADALVFGRRTGVGRRGFLKGAGLAAMGAAVGGSIPFARNMPAGLVPAALAQGQPSGGQGGAPGQDGGPSAQAPKTLQFPGKDGNLVVLGERPLVAETPEHLLDDDTTPIGKFYIRNNGLIPDQAPNADAWVLTVDGEVNTPLKITVGELKSRFPQQTFRMVMECGGNGRSFFSPPGRGNQWTNGGAGCAEWTGVRLRDVLQAAGLKSSAVYTGHYGADPHLSGDPTKESLSRGVPMAKAMEEHSLIVFAMNGQPLPNIHGFPARLIIPGWPGSASQKWLTRIWVRDKVHDGQGMGGTSYRVPIKPMIPGAEADPKNFRILESMPVRSIITNPANGTELPAGTREIALRGAAWNGDHGVKAVHVSIDYGATWQEAQLASPRNRYDWRRWTASVKLPSEGYFELWCRATDDNGLMQPHVAGNWNPQGYGANPLHRVAVLVAS